MEIATIQDFWALVVDVWENGFYGLRIADSLLALLIFFAFMLLRNLFTRFILTAIGRAIKRTQTELDDRVLDALTKPIRFIPVVMGIFFATSILQVDEDTRTFFNNINRSLVAFTLFWALYRAVTPIGSVLMKASAFLSTAMVDWLTKAAKVAFILLGGATILEMWGISVGPIIAGLGLFGVALALGAQDLFKNLIAGIFVIGERRFYPGDWINVDAVVEGTVERIGFRTTMVRRFDKAPVYVPNSKLSDNAVTNFSRMTHRRIKWLIGVKYTTTKEQLRTIRDEIEAYIHGNEEFASPSDVATFVRIDAFSDNAIDILLYCFTRTTNWGEWLAIKEQLALKIKEIVEGAGSGFAIPSRALYLETTEDAAELFPFSAPDDSADSSDKKTQQPVG